MTQDNATTADLMSTEASATEGRRPKRSYTLPVLAFTQLTGSILYERLVNGFLG